jgi:8-oxo-dGTP pyrophosphatase MutT (NUDIX family)
VTPRPAATLIMIQPGGDGPEVLMLQRPARGFFGGLWVFPGGVLEEIDHGTSARQTVIVPDGADDLPWRSAALRETVEEVGIALTAPQVTDPIEAVGEAVFRTVQERGAVLDGSRLRLLSRWVTPEGLPTRFDARFYLAVVETSPPAVARTGEVVDTAWITPSEGLARRERGEWAMVTPTVHHLQWLAGLADVDDIWTAAGRAGGGTTQPTIESDGFEVWVRLPAAADLP